MPIYDTPVRLLMVEMSEALCPERTSIFTRAQAVSWFAANYPNIKLGTVTAHLTRLSVNAPSRVHYKPKPDDDVLYQIDRNVSASVNPPIYAAE